MEYYHLPLVHDDVLLYSNEKFYNLVNELARENVLSILKIQSIHSVQSLLHTNNVVELFNYDCSDLIEIKKKSCFMLSDGTYIIKCGIINGLNYLTNILKLKDEQRTKLNESSSSLNELIIKHPLLKALISYYKTSTISLNKHQEGFLTTLINNITSNLKCPKNNVRYNQTMLNFALSLFILGGKNAYEFTRLNISQALPSLTTLKKITSNNNENVIEEGKFQIDHLLKHASVIDCRYGFMSEDCTGVIQKIEYDSATNTFIGFSIDIRCPHISNNLRSSSNVTDNTMIADDVDNESDTCSSSGNEDNDYYGEDDESENIFEGEDDDKIPLHHFAQVRNTTFSELRLLAFINAVHTIPEKKADQQMQ
ncbi:unnamed protein product [Didymodactylos carnosus]|uniref:THAP9-like helix-turn-helix domain-containing protein n=2 Tax=Didymodactylos carnosus TaxID=1234261 RepID=A0A814X5J6_9BILA|nr:unnamed protein product [Didymodactylos carnosus]CAF3977335.1 unnamed protein product [Didymodactylos carnosus]